MDTFKHTAKKKKIKRTDQILPEVYGTTLISYRKHISILNCLLLLFFYFFIFFTINKATVLLPRAEMTLANLSYHVNGLWFSGSQRLFRVVQNLQLF